MILFGRRIQFIWWGYFIGFKIHKWEDPYNYHVLDFSLNIFVFEIRVWQKEQSK